MVTLLPPHPGFVWYSPLVGWSSQLKRTALIVSTSGYQAKVGASGHKPTLAQMKSHWQVSLCEVQVDFQKHLPRPTSVWQPLFSVRLPSVVSGYSEKADFLPDVANPASLHLQRMYFGFSFQEINNKENQQNVCTFPSLSQSYSHLERFSSTVVRAEMRSLCLVLVVPCV